MNIIVTFITKRILSRFIGSFIVFSFIMTMLKLIKMADMIFAKGIDPFLVLKLLFFMVCYLFVYVVPISIFIAILLTFGELYATKEIVALRSSGICDRRVFIPSILLSVLMTVICLGLNLSWLPRAHYAFKNTYDLIKMHGPSSIVDAGTFISLSGGRTMYVSKVSNDVMYGINIYETVDDKKTRVIHAQKGIVERTAGQYMLTLFTGEINEFLDSKKEGPRDYLRLFFAAYTIQLDASSGLKKYRMKKIEDMDITELIDARTTMGKEGVDPSVFDIAIFKRISLALGCLSLALCAYPLGGLVKREEKSVYFAITFIVIVVFYVLLAAGEAVASKKLYPASLSILFANLFFSAFGLIFFRDEINIRIPFLNTR